MIKRDKVKPNSWIYGNGAMILSFHPCIVADFQIILGDRALNSEDLALIRKADAIILPQSCSVEIYEVCQDSPARVFPNYDIRFRYPGKIGQSRLFKELRLPYPDTLQWPSVERFREKSHKVDDLPQGMPFLIKADRGHEGEGVYLITDQRALELSLKRLNSLEKAGLSGFISQELIPSDGNVLRAVILGNRTITYWKRTESHGQIIATISRGAKIEDNWRVDLQEKGTIQAQKFYRATGINLAAIDFVFPFDHPDPHPLFLEINYYFGRRGLGGSLNYYRLLFEAVREWLKENGLDPESVKLV